MPSREMWENVARLVQVHNVILLAEEELARKRGWHVTDTKMDLQFCYANIRLEGPGFNHGSCLQMFMAPLVAEVLVVTWKLNERTYLDGVVELTPEEINRIQAMELLDRVDADRKRRIKEFSEPKS